MKLKMILGTAVVSMGLVLAGCSTGGDSYDDFQSAVRSGASCDELFDQRSNFDDDATLEKIDADLADIGCEDRDSERTDR